MRKFQQVYTREQYQKNTFSPIFWISRHLHTKKSKISDADAV